MNGIASRAGRRAACLLLALALAAGLLCGCAAGRSRTPPTAQSMPEATAPQNPGSGTNEWFASFTRELFVNSLQANGLTLNYTLADPDAWGISRQIEEPLGVFSPEGWLEDQRAIREELDWLRGFDRDTLSPDQKLTWDVLEYYLMRQDEYGGMELHDDPLGSAYGVHTSLPVTLAEFRFGCAGDIELYLALLEDFPRCFDEVALFEEYRAKAGYFMGDEQLNALLAFCREDAGEAVGALLRESFAYRLAQLDWLEPDYAAAYTRRSEELIEGSVLAAYRQLADRLEPLRGSGPERPGLGQLPRAEEYFAWLLRDQVGIDCSYSEVSDRLTARMDELLEEMGELTALDPTLPDAYYAWTGPDMTPEEILADLRQKSAEEFPLPRQAECTVKEVIPALREYLSPAFYLVPPLDSPEQNVIYLNPAQLGSGAVLYTTLAHEGYPGHLCQSVLAAENGLDPVRSLLTWRGYSEGWASYVEFQYAYAWALPDNALLARYAAAADELGLLLMAQIDQKINAYHFANEKQIASVMSRYGFDPERAGEVIQLVVEAPGDYLCYAMGELEFLRLRQKAEEALGDGFDPVAFHTVLLEGGEMPFPLLEARLDAWLAAQQAAK